VLFFLGTICNGVAQGLYEGCVIPSCSSKLNSAFAAISLSGANLRGLDASGGPGVVLMKCFVSCLMFFCLFEGCVIPGYSIRMLWYLDSSITVLIELASCLLEGPDAVNPVLASISFFCLTSGKR